MWANFTPRGKCIRVMNFAPRGKFVPRGKFAPRGKLMHINGVLVSAASVEINF